MRMHPKIIESITPDLTPEEKARNIENFVDTLARVTEAKGYQGCKYDNETNTVYRYWD